MVEIIPAILAKDFEEIREQILKVEPYVNWVQVDVSDGKFAANATWNNPEDLKGLDARIFLEVHLMISDPARYIDQWIDSGAKRIIIHVEAVKGKLNQAVNNMIKKAHKAGIAFGIAINPESPLSVIEDLILKVDLVLLLAVSPGFGGQKFKEIVLEKIKSLQKTFPKVKIEVDGGINPKTGRKCIEAGADILVSGSYIFGSKDIKKTIKKLRAIA